jgi:hypothetical protein
MDRMFVVTFAFVYSKFDSPFFVFLNEEGIYLAKVFDLWVYGSTVGRVTKEIDEYCYELMEEAQNKQG